MAVDSEVKSKQKHTLTGDLGRSKKLLAVSTFSMTGLLAICLVGGYTLYKQTRSTQQQLRISQTRADAAMKAQEAILIMGKAEAQLVTASDLEEQRRDAVQAILASSTLDESIQRLDQALTGNIKVKELSRSLQEINPMKLAIVRAVRANKSDEAKSELHRMEAAMWRIEQISGELVQEENDNLMSAVVNQGKQTSSTLRWLAGLAGACIVLTVFSARGLSMRTSQLSASRQESEMFINCVPSILIGMDNKGHVMRWNQSASAVFDLSWADVQGKPIYDCGIRWLNCDLQRNISGWLALEQALRLDDYTFKKGDDIRVLGLTVNPVRFTSDRAAAFLLTGADITDRRTMERELRQGQKLEAIGQLAAGIAHEINTPVQYARDNVTFVQQSWQSIAELLSLARLMTMEIVLDGSSPPSVNDFESRRVEIDLDFLQKDVPTALEQSLEELERVAKIVRAMKEFSHPGSTEKVPLDINRAIESTIAVARNEWKYVADVTTDFDETLPKVSCYAGEFNQVILNLLVNASHAVGDIVKVAPHGK
ncbi:MAG TPA: hypothetical protein VLK33_09170, partial [Terriglobales bacterium]|nr:hypothetical protein [Terriglobales bacterium]